MTDEPGWFALVGVVPGRLAFGSSMSLYIQRSLLSDGDIHLHSTVWSMKQQIADGVNLKNSRSSQSADPVPSTPSIHTQTGNWSGEMGMISPKIQRY
jgi:hypothetical protein